MKKYLPIILIVLFLAILQSSFFLELLGSELNPNLVLALAFAFVIPGNKNTAFFIAFTGGIFLDLLGAGVIGLSSLVLVSSVLFSSFAKNYLTKGNFPFSVTLIFFSLASSSVQLGYLAINFKSLFSAILTLAISFILYWLFTRFSNLVEKSEYKIKTKI